jgi:hypothetical protein
MNPWGGIPRHAMVFPRINPWVGYVLVPPTDESVGWLDNLVGGSVWAKKKSRFAGLFILSSVD